MIQDTDSEFKWNLAREECLVDAFVEVKKKGYINYAEIVKITNANFSARGITANVIKSQATSKLQKLLNTYKIYKKLTDESDVEWDPVRNLPVATNERMIELMEKAEYSRFLRKKFTPFPHFAKLEEVFDTQFATGKSSMVLVSKAKRNTVKEAALDCDSGNDDNNNDEGSVIEESVATANAATEPKRKHRKMDSPKKPTEVELLVSAVKAIVEKKSDSAVFHEALSIAHKMMEEGYTGDQRLTFTNHLCTSVAYCINFKIMCEEDKKLFIKQVLQEARQKDN